MKKVVFLDRDGTINVDHQQGYVADIKDWKFVDQAITGLQTLQNAGFTLAVITNQSGIAAGLYTSAQMRQVHAHMLEQLAEQGVTIEAIAFCPHARDSLCDCRKPQPGMSKHIEEQIGAIDYEASWTIGDKVADLQFGQNIGSRTALIRSPHWQESDITAPADIYVASLYEAAQKIVTL